ncbi:uncharacterized protein DS421_9g267860 [Arachis hypogaea]|nr:uncharacterized protein DS421_9g267860 [Arachis hypogaea]
MAPIYMKKLKGLVIKYLRFSSVMNPQEYCLKIIPFPNSSREDEEAGNRECANLSDSMARWRAATKHRCIDEFFG